MQPNNKNQLIHIKTPHYEFKYINIKYLINIIHPAIEIKRYLLMYFDIIKHILNVFAENNISIIFK